MRHHHHHLSNPFRSRGRRMGDDDMHSDDPYLSYHDICLMKEDIDCLRDDWLTDNNIAFYEEYLEHEKFPLYRHPRSKVCLVRPSMVYLLMNIPDPISLESALPPFKAAQYSHIFLPINNNHDPTVAEGGSHWSLLVISVLDSAAFHYDSLNSSNIREAEIACQKMSVILSLPLRFLDVENTPQQDNSSDCGVHVCLTMKFLALKRLLAVEDGKEVVDMGLAGLKWDCSDGRKEMLGHIKELRKQAERSESSSLNGKDGSPPRIE